MWNPKTSKTWGIDSFNGWAPSRLNDRLPTLDEASAMAVWDDWGAEATDQPPVAPFKSTDKVSEQKVALDRPSALHAANHQSARSTLFPTSGAQSTAFSIPFAPQDRSLARPYSNFPAGQPEFQGTAKAPFRLEVADENAFPDNRNNALARAPIGSQRMRSVLTEISAPGNVPPNPSQQLQKPSETCFPSSSRTQAANIWSIGEGADLSEVPLGGAGAHQGVGQLLFGEPNECGPRTMVSEADRTPQSVALWTSFSGDSSLFPVPSDQIPFAAGSRETYPFEEANGASAKMEFGVLGPRYGIQPKEELDLPSPMPPKPKVMLSTSPPDSDSSWQTVTKTCDKVVARAISHVVLSFGGGAVEQGRIGNALSKEETLRTYIKDKHGSLINFFLSDEASRWFNVTAGVNGCYYVEVRRGQ